MTSSTRTPTDAQREDPTDAQREDPTDAQHEDSTDAQREDPTDAQREDPCPHDVHCSTLLDLAKVVTQNPAWDPGHTDTDTCPWDPPPVNRWKRPCELGPSKG